MPKNKNQSGFIPMIIIIIIVLGVVVWLGYKHVNDAHKKTVLQRASQIENTLNQ